MNLDVDESYHTCAFGYTLGILTLPGPADAHLLSMSFGHISVYCPDILNTPNAVNPYGIAVRPIILTTDDNGRFHTEQYFETISLTRSSLPYLPELLQITIVDFPNKRESDKVRSESIPDSTAKSAYSPYRVQSSVITSKQSGRTEVYQITLL
uniref:Uncharacterized protein n=1 Tax=Romanomermis culicivorax TaxID=13658 RepID=A0A915JJZ8_ROMCU